MPAKPAATSECPKLPLVQPIMGTLGSTPPAVPHWLLAPLLLPLLPSPKTPQYGVDLGLVALHRARGVALDVRHGGRRDAEHRVGVAQRAQLARLVGLERQARAGVVEAHAEQRPIDAVAVAHGVGVPLHDHDGAALPGGQP